LQECPGVISLAMIWRKQACPAVAMDRRRPSGGAALVRLAAAILAAFLVVAPGRGRAEESPGPSAWAYSLYKTVTYEVMANGADFILYTTVLGGTAAGAAPFLAVNAVAAASAYYVHEVSWNLFGPVPETRAGTVELGLTKTLTYRVISTAQHWAVAYAFTGSAWAAAGYAAATNLSDVFIYVANEYGWDVYGPPLPGASATPQGAQP
jgi:uncharacterized membrane protein